ncbi:MAG: hypothetical protein WBZ36_11050 [Candidatus Nitrosopolaris sp.]
MTDETFKEYLLNHCDNPEWLKEKIRSLTGLVQKYRPSTEPSWRRNAFGEGLRRSVVESIMRHASNCQECFDKINSGPPYYTVKSNRRYAPNIGL